MAKVKTAYACQECGALSPKWQGQCSECANWNTLVEITTAKPLQNHGYAGSQVKSQKLNEVSLVENPLRGRNLTRNILTSSNHIKQSLDAYGTLVPKA